MNTAAKKKKALAGAVKTNKKPVKKKTIVSLWDEAQERGKKLFEQGILKPFNRKEIYEAQ